MLSTIPLNYIIILVSILFSLGVFGILTRRNIIVILMCSEIMLNSVNLLFIAFARNFKDLQGEVFVLFVMAIAAAEAAIGLALVISVYRSYHTLDLKNISELKN